MLLFILTNFLLFLPFTIIYAKARVNYRKLNFRQQQLEAENIIQTMLAEFGQFINTIKTYKKVNSKLRYLPLNFFLFIDQLSDVWHNGVLLIINKISLARPWLAALIEYQLFWCILSFIFPLAAIKNASRYFCTGCIIKHSNDKRNRTRRHNCSYHGKWQNAMNYLGW